jgi:hypothetical protein
MVFIVTLVNACWVVFSFNVFRRSEGRQLNLEQRSSPIS